MPRWVTQVSPVDRGMSRYLARRSMRSTVAPSSRAGKRSGKGKRRSGRFWRTRVRVAPTMTGSSPRRTVSTSGSSGIERAPAEPEQGQGFLREAGDDLGQLGADQLGAGQGATDEPLGALEDRLQRRAEMSLESFRHAFEGGAGSQRKGRRVEGGLDLGPRLRVGGDGAAEGVDVGTLVQIEAGGEEGPAAVGILGGLDRGG